MHIQKPISDNGDNLYTFFTSCFNPSAKLDDYDILTLSKTANILMNYVIRHSEELLDQPRFLSILFQNKLLYDQWR